MGFELTSGSLLVGCAEFVLFCLCWRNACTQLLVKCEFGQGCVLHRILDSGSARSHSLIRPSVVPTFTAGPELMVVLVGFKFQSWISVMYDGISLRNVFVFSAGVAKCRR